MEFTATFLTTFLLAIQLGSPLFLSLIFSIVLMGLFSGRLEKWKPGESVYWSFITATTVGYGDYRPTHKLSRIMAIVIAVQGLIFFAILGAIAVQATRVAIDRHLEHEIIAPQN